MAKRTCINCESEFLPVGSGGSHRKRCYDCLPQGSSTVPGHGAVRLAQQGVLPLCAICGTNRVGLGSRGRVLRYCSESCRNQAPHRAAKLARTAALLITEKHCQQCDQTLPLADFHNDRRRTDGHYPWCKDCRRNYMGASRKASRKFKSKREYDIDYRAKSAAYAKTSKTRARHLWTMYRITPEDYARLLTDQGGACAICHTTDTPSSSKYGNTYYPFHVDHDHACCPGSKSCGHCIRGLLCSKCNTGLGLFDDDLVRMNTAIEYLRECRAVSR